jgi:hypothetical protein
MQQQQGEVFSYSKQLAAGGTERFESFRAIGLSSAISERLSNGYLGVFHRPTTRKQWENRGLGLQLFPESDGAGQE